MSLPDILSMLVVVIAAPLTWLVALLLWRLSNRDSSIRLLRAHAVAALALAIIVSVFAAIFVNNGLVPPPLDTPTTQIVTRGTLLIVSTISALYWLRVVGRAS
jgi:hypothetical protein